MLYFLQALRKEGLFKRGCAGAWSFLYDLERWYFFPENTIFFSWARSQRWPFCVHVWVLQTWCHVPPAKKNQGWPYPAKIHLKVIDVLGWHPGKSPSNSPYLHRDLYGRFHVLLCSEKKTGNLIYRIEVWLLLQFIWLEIFYNEQSSIPCTT